MKRAQYTPLHGGPGGRFGNSGRTGRTGLGITGGVARRPTPRSTKPVGPTNAGQVYKGNSGSVARSGSEVYCYMPPCGTSSGNSGSVAGGGSGVSSSPVNGCMMVAGIMACYDNNPAHPVTEDPVGSSGSGADASAGAGGSVGGQPSTSGGGADQGLSDTSDAGGGSGGDSGTSGGGSQGGQGPAGNESSGTAPEFRNIDPEQWDYTPITTSAAQSGSGINPNQWDPPSGGSGSLSMGRTAFNTTQSLSGAGVSQPPPSQPSATNTSTTTASPRRFGWQSRPGPLRSLTTRQFMDLLVKTHLYRQWKDPTKYSGTKKEREKQMDAFGARLQKAFLKQYTWHGKNVAGLKDWGYGPDKNEFMTSNIRGAGQMYQMKLHMDKFGQKSNLGPFLNKMRLGSGGRGRLYLTEKKYRTGAWGTDRLRTGIMEAMTPDQLRAMRTAFGVK